MSALTLAGLAPVLETMRRWAVAQYPRECCGLLLEGPEGLEALCCENQQDALHERFPEDYPRTSATAYSLDPLELMRAEEAGRTVRGVFHSHPDRGAYFSDEDVRMALGGNPSGDPVLPGVDYVVLSVRADGVDDVRLFCWNSARRTFEEG